MGPNRVVSTWARKSLGGDLLEEPGVEVAGVVDQHVDAAEPFHGRLHGRLGVGGVGDVELDRQQVLVLSLGRGDGVGVAGGSDHGVAGRERGRGDVDAHPAAGAGDEPNLLVSQLRALLWLMGRAPRHSRWHGLQDQPAREGGRP
jgi:hypothetical protein